MDSFIDFVLILLSQFAGGTGQFENNLVRFSIPAITYAVLLNVAWSRQREYRLPREKMLVWGFAFGSASALIMVVFDSLQMLQIIQRDAFYGTLVPAERTLEMASIVVVAGAFLRYILDDSRLAQRYIQVGLGVTLVSFAAALWLWPRYLAELTVSRFHTSWAAWYFQIFNSIFIVIAIILLNRKRNWLVNLVTVALLFFFLGEALSILNFATDKAYEHTICPVANFFPILAIPVLGYVYVREQAMETKQAQKDLLAYRNHLEDLVIERTAEIAAVNSQLQGEVQERERAQIEIAQRNENLAAQNMIASALSRSLDLETVLDTALDAVLSVVDMDAGLVYLCDSTSGELSLRSYRGKIFQNGAGETRPNWSCCEAVSADAVKGIETIVISYPECAGEAVSALAARDGFETLVSVPLVSKGNVMGALTLGSRVEAVILPHHLELLTVIGQQVGMAVENAQLYLKAEQAAALEERQRIAADMHDGLAQTVNLLGLQIEEAIDLISSRSSEKAVEGLERTRETVGQVSVEVRRSIASLQEAPQPRRSLQEMLANAPKQLSWENGLPVDFQIRAQEPLFLPREKSDQVVMIVQEALLNAYRHARARHISLTLDRQSQDVIINVADDGAGFESGAWWENSQDHFGLGIMHSRAARIGARLHLDSAPGQGTRVILTVPVDGRAFSMQPGGVLQAGERSTSDE